MTLRSTYRLAATMVAALVLLLLLPARAAHAQASSCPTGRAGTRYKVKIDSAPQGATVYFGTKDCSVGVTPWAGTVPRGAYPVGLEIDGYAPATRVITVIRSKTLQETFVPLVKKVEPPRIDIRADADKNIFGASVTLDGQPQGTIPVVLTTTAGRHQIRISKDGYEPIEQWIEVKENERPTLSLVLKELPKPKFGILIIDSDVPECDVYVDGAKHPDSTPAVIQNVAVGIHQIEVRKDKAVWKQTVQVSDGQSQKLKAELKASMRAPTGTIRVISNIDKTKIFLDGVEVGVVPSELREVQVGDHVIEGKLEGYGAGLEKVTVVAGGTSVVQLKLEVAGGGDGTIAIVASVPDAQVVIDGASIGKAPQNKTVAPGEHFVSVKAAGFKPFETKIIVVGGQTAQISADLKAAGRLRVLSTPDGADVVINGLVVGKTPLETDVEVGSAVVRVQAPGFRPDERTVEIVGGKSDTISAELVINGQSDDELAVEQRSLSSWGARTLPRGRAMADISVGYPYFVDARITVGAGRLSNFGFDAMVGVRTMASRSELGLGARLMVGSRDPFTAAVFSDMWFGSTLFDNSKRNGLTWDAGVAGSLTALAHVTITGRAYLNVWSDRHCPEIKSGDTLDGDGVQACKDYLAHHADNGGAGTPDTLRLEDLTGVSHSSFKDMFNRENGLRFMTEVIAEFAVQQRWNVWTSLEGAPFQSERALFTDPFSGPMTTTDYILYVRAGVSYKF